LRKIYASIKVVNSEEEKDELKRKELENMNDRLSQLRATIKPIIDRDKSH